MKENIKVFLSGALICLFVLGIIAALVFTVIDIFKGIKDVFIGDTYEEQELRYEDREDYDDYYDDDYDDSYTSSGTPINREFDIDSVSMESTPNSDCFSAIGYKTFQKILVVTFRDSGASYIYKDVPYSVWSDLKGADSMGGYYNKYIKGKYECEKLW